MMSHESARKIASAALQLYRLTEHANRFQDVGTIPPRTLRRAIIDAKARLDGVIGDLELERKR
jgi:hypothetical protein